MRQVYWDAKTRRSGRRLWRGVASVLAVVALGVGLSYVPLSAQTPLQSCVGLGQALHTQDLPPQSCRFVVPNLDYDANAPAESSNIRVPLNIWVEFDTPMADGDALRLYNPDHPDAWDIAAPTSAELSRYWGGARVGGGGTTQKYDGLNGGITLTSDYFLGDVGETTTVEAPPESGTLAATLDLPRSVPSVEVVVNFPYLKDGELNHTDLGYLMKGGEPIRKAYRRTAFYLIVGERDQNPPTLRSKELLLRIKDNQNTAPLTTQTTQQAPANPWHPDSGCTQQGSRQVGDYLLICWPGTSLHEGMDDPFTGGRALDCFIDGRCDTHPNDWTWTPSPPPPPPADCIIPTQPLPHGETRTFTCNDGDLT